MLFHLILSTSRSLWFVQKGNYSFVASYSYLSLDRFLDRAKLEWLRVEFIESKFSKNSSFNNLIFVYIYICVYVCIYTLPLSPLCKKNFHPLKKFVAFKLSSTRVPLVPLTKKPVPRLILNFPFLFSLREDVACPGVHSACVSPSSSSSSSVLRHKDEIRGVTKVDAYVYVCTPTVEEDPRHIGVGQSSII